MNVMERARKLLVTGASAVINHDKDKRFFDTLKLPKYTPDVAHLARFQHQFIFNYAPGFLNGIPDEHLDIKGYGFTEDDGLIMWKKLLGDLSYPVPMGHDDTVPDKSHLNKLWVRRDGMDSKRELLFPPARVRGFLCKIKYPEHWFQLLDERTFNGVMFVRERVKVMIMYHAPDTPIWDPMVTYVNAWMYKGEPDYWKDQIIKSDDPMRQTLVKPVDVFRAKNKNIGSYYYFSELEYKNDPVPAMDWAPTTWTFGHEGTPEQRRKRLINLNKELLVVKPRRRKITLPLLP
jgi:hypothetical protein